MNDDHASLTLTGSWRDCPALQDAYDKGSIVLDESDFCKKVGCQPEELEDYLQKNWREHDINAHETDQVDQTNMSLVKQHRGYFTWRLFSPVEPDSAIVRQLHMERVRPQVM